MAAAGDGGAEAGRVCVVVPHFKDEYWLSVGFGLMEEARESGTEVLMFEAGGYHSLQRQIELLETCIARQADAILLGAVSADDPRLLLAVKRAARGIPVVALVNEFRSPDLSGAVGVDWREMGLVIGQYLSRRYPAGSPPVAAALVTGPARSGWSPLLESGLRAGLEGSAVDIRFTGRSDTGLREQLVQVEAALKDVEGLQILIGSAPAIEGAMGLSASSGKPFPVLVSTYISHSVRRGIQSGAVAAVAFDDPVEQGRMGLRAALSAVEGIRKAGIFGPEIRLEAADTAEQAIRLSPASLALQIE